MWVSSKFTAWRNVNIFIDWGPSELDKDNTIT